MAPHSGSPHLARNAVLAVLAVLGTTAAVTAGAAGAGRDSCPGGEDWVVAQPVVVALAGYGVSSTTGGADTAPVVLTGCVDTERLHPVPGAGDGRG